MPWGSETELERAQSIARVSDQVKVLDAMNLTELTHVMQAAQGIVAVDTGLAHVAAALNVTLVNVFGSTNAKLTAALGPKVITLASNYHCSPCMRQQCQFSEQRMNPPCYQQIGADQVWNALKACR